MTCTFDKSVLCIVEHKVLVNDECTNSYNELMDNSGGIKWVGMPVAILCHMYFRILAMKYTVFTCISVCTLTKDLFNLHVGLSNHTDNVYIIWLMS